MDMGLVGKVVIVTGGASGIGAAISISLAAEGAVPVILTRSTPAPEFMLEMKANSHKGKSDQGHAHRAFSVCRYRMA